MENKSKKEKKERKERKKKNSLPCIINQETQRMISTFQCRSNNSSSVVACAQQLVTYLDEREK